MATKTKREDRFINPDLRRSFRKTYNVQEVKWGAVVVTGLLVLLAWIIWMGAHPDPELFSQGPDLLVSSGSPAERGVLPKPLAPAGFKEASVSRFGPENLYEKINGREGFYKGFGFQSLTFASLVAAENPGMAIDIELYDLGEPLNAVGCYAAERQPDAKTTVEENGLYHLARNGLFITRGRYYARAIAPDETRASLDALAALQTTLSTLPGEPLPWGYSVLSRDPKVDLGTVEAFQADAFSFAFARNVFTAQIGAGETRIFISPVGSADEYQAAFAELGEVVQGDIPWSEDPYLKELSGARDVDSWVVGVRSAPDVATANAALSQVTALVQGLPADLITRAQGEPEAPGDVEPAAEDDEPSFDSDEEYDEY
ncbi:MAG: DUF6599 family protein [Myxococcota bacterium]